MYKYGCLIHSGCDWLSVQDTEETLQHQTGLNGWRPDRWPLVRGPRIGLKITGTLSGNPVAVGRHENINIDQAPGFPDDPESVKSQRRG
jgi:hypothetical protein